MATHQCNRKVMIAIRMTKDALTPWTQRRLFLCTFVRCKSCLARSVSVSSNRRHARAIPLRRLWHADEKIGIGVKSQFFDRSRGGVKALSALRRRFLCLRWGALTIFFILAATLHPTPCTAAPLRETAPWFTRERESPWGRTPRYFKALAYKSGLLDSGVAGHYVNNRGGGGGGLGPVQ